MSLESAIEELVDGKKAVRMIFHDTADIVTDNRNSYLSRAFFAAAGPVFMAGSVVETGVRASYELLRSGPN